MVAAEQQPPPGRGTARPVVAALLAATLVGSSAWLCFRAGGFFDEPRTGIGVALWLALAVAAVAGLPVWPRTLGARLAVGGMVGLAGWTAASLLWAPLEVPARSDAVRLALYAAVLWLGLAALRDRRVARATELAVAALVAAVGGYALLGEAGVLDLTASAGAAGRLEQPLSYWNGMGALGAMGTVLCVRIATDSTRRMATRVLAGLAVPALVAVVYLTYSRGALVALAVGLAVLGALWARGRWPSARRGWRAGGAVALVAVVALGGVAVVASSKSAQPPADSAQAGRFADIGSNRSQYWDVALGTFAANPVAGAGTSAFRMQWLRERTIDETVADAHSLPLETAAELGLVGLALLAALVGGVMVSGRRALAVDGALAAGPVALLAVWAVHVCLDWGWELPGVTLLALLAAAMLVARAEEAA